MKVKSSNEIVKWLLKNDYVFGEYEANKPNNLPFNYKMFTFCGKTPAIEYKWFIEWFEEDPKDYEGRICKVWNDEPSDIYKRVIWYEPEFEHPFQTLESAWKHARPLTPKDLLTKEKR